MESYPTSPARPTGAWSQVTDMWAQMFPDLTLREVLDEMDEQHSGGTLNFITPLVASIKAISAPVLITIVLGILVFMYLIDAIPSLFTLRWRHIPKEHPLPAGMKREHVKTWEGDLEILISEPPKSVKVTSPPILFIHGGFGSASVWLPWITVLHKAPSPYPGRIYALSLRGHGGSWAPSYFELAFITSMTPLCVDVDAAIRIIERIEQGSKRPEAGVVLVGHSNGGGLLQYGLASGKIVPPKGGVKGLGLVASIPNFGAGAVFRNWLRSDPWLLVRGACHFQHPRSALSTTRLVKRAFFSEGKKIEEVREFSEWLSEVESLQVPLQTVIPGFADAESVLGAEREGEGSDVGSVLVMAGEEDRLMRVDLMKRMAEEYDVAIRTMQKVEGKSEPRKMQAVSEWIEEVDIGGVKMITAKGSGHHLQNDVHAEEAGEAFKRWAEQL